MLLLLLLLFCCVVFFAFSGHHVPRRAHYVLHTALDSMQVRYLNLRHLTRNFHRNRYVEVTSETIS